MNNNQNYTRQHNGLRGLIISGQTGVPLATNKRWEKENEGFKGGADVPRPLEQDTFRKIRGPELSAAKVATKNRNKKGHRKGS